MHFILTLQPTGQDKSKSHTHAYILIIQRGFNFVQVHGKRKVMVHSRFENLRYSGIDHVE